MRKTIFLAAIVIVCLTSIAWLLLSPCVATGLYSDQAFEVAKKNAFEAGNLQAFKCATKRSYTIAAVDGTQLHGWSFAGKSSPSDVAIYYMGRGVNVSTSLELVEIMLESGYSPVIAFDYRGFGSSPGSPSFQGIVEDALSVYDFVTGPLGYSQDQVTVYGKSLGGYPASQVAKLRNPNALILQATFESLERISKEQMFILFVYPSAMYPAEARTELDAGLRDKHPPVLFIHGRRDKVIDIANSRAMYIEAIQPKEILELPDSDHVTLPPADRANMIATLTQFRERNHNYTPAAPPAADMLISLSPQVWTSDPHLTRGRASTHTTTSIN